MEFLEGTPEARQVNKDKSAQGISGAGSVTQQTCKMKAPDIAETHLIWRSMDK